MQIKLACTAAALTLALASGFVQAQPASAAKPGAQQSKMADCNKEAGEKSLKGDERKKFMSTCLSAKKQTQQDKMKACNKDAGDKALKGDDRKKFMSECLKG
jgi:psiF repeat